jgi:hypothetical protein
MAHPREVSCLNKSVNLSRKDFIFCINHQTTVALYGTILCVNGSGFDTNCRH